MTAVPIGLAEHHSNTMVTDKSSKHSVLKLKASVDIADRLWMNRRTMTLNPLSLSSLGKIYV